MTSKQPKTNRLLCYPMRGPVEKQYTSLVNILNKIKTEKYVQENFVKWMQSSYELSNSYARKVISVLFLGMGLIERQKKRYKLSDIGKKVLRTNDPIIFYRIFSKTFFAVDILLKNLGNIQPARLDILRDSWSKQIRTVRKETRSWSKKHLNNQLRFRLDWLRSLDLVDFITGQYYV